MSAATVANMERGNRSQPFAPPDSSATSNAPRRIPPRPCAGFAASLSGNLSGNIERGKRAAPVSGDRVPVYPATSNAANVRRLSAVRPCAPDSSPVYPATPRPRNRSGLSAISGKPSAVATYPATSNAANGKQNAAPHFGTRRNLSGKPWRHLAAPDSTKTPRPCVKRRLLFPVEIIRP